jgi:ADP-ribose pyrophosphatase
MKGNDHTFVVKEEKVLGTFGPRTAIVSYREHPINKKIIDFLLIKQPDVALVFALSADKLIYLVRQYRQGISAMTTEIPTGFINHGEKPEDAARRELEEETGHHASKLTFLGKTCANSSLLSSTFYYYLAEEVERAESPAAADEQELISSVTMPLNEYKQRLLSGEEEYSSTFVLAGLMLLQKAKPGLF